MCQGPDEGAIEPPHFATEQAYAERFTNADFWRPYVEAICARHALAECARIRAGLPGTNPVFIVGERYAVKLYTPFFDGAESFPAELDLYALIARTPDFPAPALVAHGRLFPGAADWDWPYIVTRVVPGASFGEVIEQVPYADAAALAEALGPLLRRLHGRALDGSRHLRPSWQAFVRFLDQQRRACARNLSRWGTMPARLIDQVDRYLPPIETLMDLAVQPRLLHCDLNEDHVLGRFEGGRWRLTGIIDFGDAKVGDPLYELAALHVGLFRCDKRLLRLFLESYGFDAEMRERFVVRTMSYALLHEFDVLGPVFAFPTARDAASLVELAALLWDLEMPGL